MRLFRDSVSCRFSAGYSQALEVARPASFGPHAGQSHPDFLNGTERAWWIEHRADDCLDRSRGICTISWAPRLMLPMQGPLRVTWIQAGLSIL